MCRLYSVVISLVIHVYAFDCQEIEKSLLKRDLSVTLVINDHDVDLEAYHTKENQEIIMAKNSQEYRHLRWFLIGYPIIVKSESKIKKQNLCFILLLKDFKRQSKC